MKHEMKALENIIDMLDKVHYVKSASKHKYGHFKEEPKKCCEKCGKDECECKEEDPKEEKKAHKEEAKKEEPISLEQIFGKKE
jgi:hypothetical protein